MVQTRSAKRIKSGQVDDNFRVLPEDGGASPPAKRRRRECAQAPNNLSRQGKSWDLIQLNLDVLYLICASLHPLDLLNLARTCKSFRGLLMSKSSAFIWRAARRQVKGLPICPVDLSEPAYANLAFCAHCHVCGKHTATIYWCIRRRYCPSCRVERLRDAPCYPWIIRNALFHIGEHAVIQKRQSRWFDRDLVDSMMQEYELSSSKEEFLKDVKQRCFAIYLHAKECEVWRRQMTSECRYQQKACREERDRSILRRLKQLGYEREISFFGPDRFREPRKKSPKPLSDREWARVLPQWLKIMDHHRQLRLAAAVYQVRRRTLVSEYKIYVRQRSPESPIFDLLPHGTDLAGFPPFRSIIEAPEETQMDVKPFAFAFEQLPTLVHEWRKHLDAELAELVKVPPCLSSEGASCDLDVTSNCTTGAEALQTGLDKLRLACALFYMDGTGVFAHPEIFSTSMLHYTYPKYNVNTSKRTGSLKDRYGILFLEEAPYIVHACKLDPNVATVDDMDRRNARLKCLACKTPNAIVMNWRDAMLHARTNHRKPLLAPLSELPRWQLVSDEYIEMIRVVEESINRQASPFYYERCLLCLPRVGDAMNHDEAIRHLRCCHEMKEDEIKPGVHYVRLGINQARSSQVEMVEEGGQVTFQEPQHRCTGAGRARAGGL